MIYCRVVNLGKYQHYKERRPPWVKLHRTVFSDYAFSRLQDASKAHLMLLWLLASEYENQLPFDAEWIGRKIDANTPVDLDELVSAGFLETYEDASVTLAPRKQEESKRGSTENREQRSDPPNGGTAKPSTIRVKKPRPAAPWMGLVRPAWTLGTLPPGAATQLEPVVAAIGAEETAERIRRYCEETDPQYASVRSFVTKHAAYADVSAVDPATGLPNAAGMRALGGGRR